MESIPDLVPDNDENADSSFEDGNEQENLDFEHAKDVVWAVHHDLGHYGKGRTRIEVQKRYSFPPSVLKRALDTLDACVNCQLYKQPTSKMHTATIHPYEPCAAFERWAMDFVGPLVTTTAGNEYLLTAIDFGTSTAIAVPLPARSAEAAIQLVEDIVWTYGVPRQILTDNGVEFRSDKYIATLTRYGIHPKRTSPGHPQTNGKVERFNHELVQRLQRMTIDDHDNWDAYVKKAIFAFHAHTNSRTGMSPFYLQHGVEPVLPSTASIAERPLSRVEIEEARLHRRNYVQDLKKHHTEAAEKYKAALERVAATRDDTPFTTPIIPGDLVMRQVLNQTSKLHPRWDGPFVILETSDKDTYQLATANGYIVKNLVNDTRVRRLDRQERTAYVNEFWNASNRLQSHDAKAAREKELHEVDMRLKLATEELLQAQKDDAAAKRHDVDPHACPHVPEIMQKIGELSAEKRTREKALKEAEIATEAATTVSGTSQEESTHGKRVRKPSRKALGL